jgi:signal peptidase I
LRWHSAAARRTFSRGDEVAVALLLETHVAMSAADTSKPKPKLNDDERAALLVRRTAAFFASVLIAPGAGHFAMGRRVRGALWFLIAALTVLPGPLFSIWTFWANLPLRVAAGIDSAVLSRPDKGLPRWAGVVGLWAALMAATFGLKAGAKMVYLGGVAADGSMAPTLTVNEQVLVDRLHTSISRGALVAVVDPKNELRMRLGRVVAIAGDKVALLDGKLVVAGKTLTAAPTSKACSYADRPKAKAEGDTVPGRPQKRQRRPQLQTLPCRVQQEQLSGVSYTVYRAKQPGKSASMPEHVVPAGQVVVVGDNRAAPSAAIGAVKIERVLGRLKSIWWSSNAQGLRWDRIGTVVR